MKYFLAVFSILWLTACGSNKKAAREEAEKQAAIEAMAPAWTRSKPIEGSYYHGIGIAVKSGPDYLSTAKNNALSDLASEISVKISSSSMLYQVEQDDRFREDFRSRIQTKSLEAVEGYELIDSYEDGRYYYVYYRLSKAKHAALKEEKKQSALAKSKDLQLEAEAMIASGDYAMGIITHIKAIETIKGYLGETLQTQYKGATTYYGNTLAQFLRSTLSEIKIIPNKADQVVKRGQYIDFRTASFTIADESLEAIESIPIYFYYSGGRLKDNSKKSNLKGQVGMELGKVDSKNPRETLTAYLDLIVIVKEATEDPLISQLVSKISVPSGQMVIEILSPTVYFSSNEKVNGQKSKTEYLTNALKSGFIKEGISIGNSKKGADYRVEIESNANNGSNTGKFYSSTLSSTVRIYDQKGSLVYSKQVQDINGVQLSYEQAAIDAYQKGAKEYSRAVFLDIKRKLFE